MRCGVCYVFLYIRVLLVAYNVEYIGTALPIPNLPTYSLLYSYSTLPTLLTSLQSPNPQSPIPNPQSPYPPNSPAPRTHSLLYSHSYCIPSIISIYRPYLSIYLSIYRGCPSGVLCVDRSSVGRSVGQAVGQAAGQSVSREERRGEGGGEEPSQAKRWCMPIMPIISSCHAYHTHHHP